MDSGMRVGFGKGRTLGPGTTVACGGQFKPAVVRLNAIRECPGWKGAGGGYCGGGGKGGRDAVCLNCGEGNKQQHEALLLVASLSKRALADQVIAKLPSEHRDPAQRPSVEERPSTDDAGNLLQTSASI